MGILKRWRPGVPQNKMLSIKIDERTLKGWKHVATREGVSLSAFIKDTVNERAAFIIAAEMMVENAKGGEGNR